MKIFLISNMYPSSDSPGFGVFVKNVADGLRPHGVDTVRKAVLKGRTVGKWRKIRKYLKLYADVARGFFSGYDAIYIHFCNQIIPVLNFLYVFRKPDIIVNFHGEDLLYPDNSFHKRLGQATEKFCRRHATGIVVPSSYYADIVERRGLIDKSRIIVSPSGGIDRDNFTPKDVSEIPEELGARLHLGYVGRLEEGKGIREFLTVIRRMSERGVPFKATIVGYGSLMPFTMQYIGMHGLSDLVTVIPGAPQCRLGDYYRSFDLLLFLSVRPEESLGLTGLEAMACGTPVVGSDVGGIASYLSDKVNGYMIRDIENTDGVVDVIMNYAASGRRERIDMYNNALATSSRYFSDKVCSRLASDFKQLLANE